MPFLIVENNISLININIFFFHPEVPFIFILFIEKHLKLIWLPKSVQVMYLKVQQTIKLKNRMFSL